MTFSPDLHNVSMLGAGDRLRTVGWLRPDHEFTRGSVSDEFLAILKHHIATAFQPVAFGGWHDCEFCDACKGYGNLIVPTSEVVYVAPEMIVHYITEHEYCPPNEFVDAVVDCPVQESPEYMALMKPYFSYFRITEPDPLPTEEQLVQLSRLLTRAFRDISRLCRESRPEAARVLADACEELPEKLSGCGLWYRHIFARLIRNGCETNPELLDYLTAYNDIFGEDTDPDTTEYLNR
ncbi:hypothetical protein [Bremerella sp.]|uniref:DUF7919 family protein n=1 Tax=Bremerella sp. TaxID=2795602 RepID=UPI00391C648D